MHTEINQKTFLQFFSIMLQHAYDVCFYGLVFNIIQNILPTPENFCMFKKYTNFSKKKNEKNKVTCYQIRKTSTHMNFFYFFFC